MTDRVWAETYVVLVPDTYTYGKTTYVRGIRIDRVRAAKPSLKSGEIAIKLRLSFAKSQLVESIPVAAIEVNNFLTAQPTPEPDAVEVENE